MIVVPAIDLKGGKVVRLVRGDFSEQLTYGEDPVAVATKWVACGAPRLHVIDLDGALTGTPRHLETVSAIAKAVPVPVQTGGGIRTLSAIKRYLDAGVAQVIVGTTACLDEGFVTQAVRAHGEKIAVAVDVKGGRVAIEGWVRKEWMKPEALIGRLIKQGVKTILYTDVSRDGTMGGPNLDNLKEILALVEGKAAFFLSGGVGSLEDLRKIRQLEPQGVRGVIVGRALYEGRLDLRAACEECSPKGSSPASTSSRAGLSKGSVSSP